MSEKLTLEELLEEIGGAIAIAKEYWEEMEGLSKEDDARLTLNVLRLEQAYTQIKECIHIAFTGSDEEDVIKETITQQKPKEK